MPSTLVRSHSSRTTTGPAEILVVGEGAARETRQLDGREEPVADAERVGGLRLLGPGERAPVGVDGRVHDLLDAPLALGPDDDAPVAERHAVAQEPRPIADGLAEEMGVPACGSRAGRSTSRSPGQAPPRAP